MQHLARRPAALLIATLCLFARPARSAEGLYLSWNDCALGGAHTSNQSFTCDTDNGQDELFCAFTMPVNANNVIAVEIVLDMQNASSPLPDWWRIDTCRPGSITASADFSGKTACVNMWNGAGSAYAQVQGFTPSDPHGADSQARIKVVGSVLPAEAVSVNTTDMYYAARVIIHHDRTVAAPTCAGCAQPACIVLNSILIGRVPGSLGGDYFLQTPGQSDANWALWQGGAGANCAAVPVHKRAWGQLKSLYR